MNYVKELGACQEAVRQDPASAEARLDLAAALMPYRRFDEAEAEAREAVRLRPDWADARVSLGFACLVQGRAEDARAELEQAVRLAPNEPMARYGLAQSLVTLGDRARALDEIAALDRIGGMPAPLVDALRAAAEALG